MEIIIFLLIGAVAGWLAGLVVRGYGFGLIGNIVVGIVGALIAGIQRRGERAFLHVLSTSTSAIRLYEQLGFRARRSATITVVTPQRVSGAQDQD